MNGALPGTQTSAGSVCNQDVWFARKSKKFTSGSADLNEVIGLAVSACIQPPVAPYFSLLKWHTGCVHGKTSPLLNYFKLDLPELI